jgi:predicted phosphodiesterase
MNSKLKDRIKYLDPELYLNKKIAVISDLHSNYDALRCAIDEIRRYKAELVVVLGDLLTYGSQTAETLNLLKELELDLPCLFIVGNHDEFYFDLQSGKNDTSYKLPEFISESVQFNLIKLDQLNVTLKNHFNWYTSIAIGPVFLSHANPYEAGNWTYLNNSDECSRAADVLIEKGFQIGVFGHTHRAYTWCNDGDDYVNKCNNTFFLNKFLDRCYILNAGSVGQPRGEGASLLFLQVTADKAVFEHVSINPDLTRYLNHLEESKLSYSTTKKLLSYFGETK